MKEPLPQSDAAEVSYVYESWLLFYRLPMQAQKGCGMLHGVPKSL